MIKASELTKLYYSIGEVAKMFDVNTSLIRSWEKEFSSIKTKKNKKSNRLFTPDNILELQKIYQLVKINGHTSDGAKDALKNGAIELKEAPPTFDHEALIESLESIKRKLIALKD